VPQSAATAIRRAIPADAEGLAALSRELGYPVTANQMAGRLADLLTREGDIVLVAESEPGQVVGWVHGAEQRLLESARRCELLGLVVDARMRGRGVGRSLVSAVEEWARGRGLEQMAVRSNVTRTESHPFYEHLGYARVKTQHAYRKRLGPTA
jgi:GNAT superfamily N-acetyltransferase